MDKLSKLPISDDMLSEIETLEVLGGSASGDVHVYAVDSCKPNTHCENAYCGNCVAQCACDTPVEGPENGDKNP